MSILDTLDNNEKRRIFDNDGLVKRYPSKFKQRAEALCYLSEKFEEGKIYTEREVNEILKRWMYTSDYVMFRRDMINYGFMTRLPDGSEYRKAEKQPTVDELLSSMC